MLKIRLLGRFEVSQEDEPRVIPSRRAQSLLAYLAMRAGTNHRREQLAGLLWPGLDDKRARNNLRQALWQLREIIGDGCIHTDKITIAFNPASDYWLDVSALRGAAGGEAAIEDLLRAVSVYEGQLLPGFYDEWIVRERERLEAVFNQTMRTLCDLLGQDGQWPVVIEQAERWLAVGGISEPAFRALITAHGAVGDLAAVSAVYQRCIKLLDDELGLEPSPETRLLYNAILTRAESAAVGKEKTLTPAERHNLPLNLSTFIGRDTDIAEIEVLLAEPRTRLLTLLGVGGIGKTRLAIQVGFQVADKFADGVRWVEIAALPDAESLPQAVAIALGLREKVGRAWLSSLLSYLHAKRLLLILDNCEHLIAACSQLADSLLRACPNIQILATSRETFGLTGERHYQVRPLSQPDPQEGWNAQELANFEAVRLFVERANDALDGFALAEENAQAITLICARLDGMPLAIELAAARMKSLNVEQLAERLDDRFHLLTGGSRNALPHQRTLRATIDWSYDRLNGGDKRLFARLSVFVGGWTLESAEAICGQGLPFAVLDGLQSLLDKSLVRQVSHTGGDTRFIMLETIREYAIEKLEESAEAEAIRATHAAIFLKVAEESENGLTGPSFKHWLARMADENNNLRAALRFSLERGHAETALRMAGALRRSWWLHGQYSEAQRWLQDALAAKGQAAPAVRAKALDAVGNLTCMLDEYDTGLPLLEESLKIFHAIGDDQGIAESLYHIGQSLMWSGQSDEAMARVTECLRICRKLNNGRRIAFCLLYLANIEMERGQFARARSLFEESNIVIKGLGDKALIADQLWTFGELLMREGDYAQAVTHLRSANALYRQLGMNEAVGLILALLALTMLRMGAAEHALAIIRESFEVLSPLGIRRYTARLLEIRAVIHVAQGSVLKAAQLLGAAGALRESIHVPLSHVESLAYEIDIADARVHAGEAAWAAAWQKGREMSPDELLIDGM